jgi:hypothetical protein
MATWTDVGKQAVAAWRALPTGRDLQEEAEKQKAEKQKAEKRRAATHAARANWVHAPETVALPRPSISTQEMARLLTALQGITTVLQSTQHSAATLQEQVTHMQQHMTDMARALRQ